MWKSYFTFCVERNTWDRLVSLYFWAQHKKGRSINFQEFMQLYRTKEFKNINLYTSDNKKLLVNRILRYENLDKEFEQVCTKLGIPFNGWKESERIKGKTRPKQAKYKNFYTPEQVQLIKKEFANEISLMGYEF